MPYDQQTPGARKARGLIRRVLGAEPVRVWPTDSPDAKFAELSGGHRVVVKWPEWRNDEESLRAEAWATGGVAKPDSGSRGSSLSRPNRPV